MLQQARRRAQRMHDDPTGHWNQNWEATPTLLAGILHQFPGAHATAND